MIVYSHRFRTVLQQVVLDLDLALTLTDAESPVSLQDNEAMLSELATSMNIQVRKHVGDNSTSYTFRKAS